MLIKARGISPPARYLVSFSIRRRIAITRFTIAVIRLIVLAGWSFLLPLFFCFFLLNVLTSFLSIIILYTCVYVNSFCEKSRKK